MRVKMRNLNRTRKGLITSDIIILAIKVVDILLIVSRLNDILQVKISIF